MQVGMLGPLEVRTGAGELVPVAGARLRALLILLALDPSTMVSTDRLIGALWGEHAPAGAGNALQTLVSRLRRAVPAIVVRPRPAGYQLDLEPDRVDAVRFARLAAAGHVQLRDDPARAAATLRDALALWRGPALADVAGADFARGAIARLDELRLTAIEDRVDADLRLGTGASPVAELEELVEAHPLREPLVARYVRALDATGRRAEALEVYERARRRIADRLGVRPSAELAALHVAMLRAEPGPPTPEPVPPGAARPSTAPSSPGPPDVVAPNEPGAAGPVRTNLRAERTSLVGRDEDLAQVGRLLAAHRMTTLTGPGGAGKTRLAIAAARARLDSAPDGAWLVELAPVTDPAHVAPAVLDALGLRQAALPSAGSHLIPVDDHVDPAGRLVSALSGRRALLVLDNCEHLIESAAALADRVLAACPGITILATSREPLTIGGEVLWPVPPLALPPESADATLIAGYASVRLLRHRARAVRPGFEVNAGNALALARICRALDGMPLAIELAAARLRAMSPQQLADRLDDRFRLLTGGSRTALARHQTLAAVVGWSWDLLDDAERALWRRLSVFAGGATLEAAERVCAGDPIDRGQVLDLLAALVDKSMLVMRDDSGTPRYQMLEIIRAYGRERLDEAGERAALRRAHGAYFLELAEIAQYELLGPGQLEWSTRLYAEHDNLHTAVRDAVDAGDTRMASRLVAALGFYWWAHGHKLEGAELAHAVLSLPAPPEETGDGVPDEARVVAHAMGGLLAVDSRYHPENAGHWLRAAADLAARIPAPRHPLVRLVNPLAAVFDSGMSEGEPVSLDALAAVADDEFPWLAATARMTRAHVALNFGHPPAGAEADFRSALETYRTVGERWGISFALSSLATLHMWRGEFPAAAANYEEALTAVGGLGGRDDEAQMEVQLARALWLLGDRDRARELLARARRLAEGIGLPEPRSQVAYIAGDLARLDGDLASARSRLAYARELIDGTPMVPQVHAMIGAALTEVAIAAGDLESARAHYPGAVTAAVASVDAPVIGHVLVTGADLALHDGAPATAATLLGASEAIRGGPDMSNMDGRRVAAAARAALGDARFDEAYRDGLSATMSTWSELPGVRPASGSLS